MITWQPFPPSCAQASDTLCCQRKQQETVAAWSPLWLTNNSKHALMRLHPCNILVISFFFLFQLLLAECFGKEFCLFVNALQTPQSHLISLTLHRSIVVYDEWSVAVIKVW